MNEAAWERVASLSELEGQERLSVIIDDLPAVLIRYDDKYYAIEDVCTHDGQPLTDGLVVNGTIECPRHGARFDLKSGAALCMPATQPIQTFDLEFRDGEIYARPSQSESSQQASFATTATPAATQAESTTVQTSEENTEEAPAASTSENSSDAPMVGAMLDSLKQVIDPELFVNIVDLGLVYDITEENNDVVVTMTLTSPSCPAGPQIVAQARDAITAMPGVNNAEIKLTMSPPWGPEMMTDDAKDQLGIF
ncbi:iron-sulfur cluster assembly protein [Rubinisphaera sp.]|uniref:iron-sulfur cluster assembly protein n=1 Tax=Rubinisphaera sp. TaxID=2024857 RepID=UPI000C0FFE34|nr:iron-sulfur cluster assembly protein [Rubinisphaera sp.]MBV11927.1 hypothetical protein [Rubinisphaera sp.]